MGKKMVAETQALEQRVKDMLGEERFAQYQEYQQTVGERTQLNLFRQEMAGQGEPVSNEQAERLLDLMREEKKQAATAAGLDFPDAVKGQFPGALGEEQLGKLLSMQEQVNDRVFQRAGSILSPSQLEAYGTHQSNQLEMVRMGLRMAQRFMAPPGDGQPK